MTPIKGRAIASTLLGIGVLLVLYAAFAETWWKYDGNHERARGGLISVTSCPIILEAGAPTRCEHWSVLDGSIKTVHPILGVATFGADLVTAVLALLAIAMMWRGRTRFLRRALPRIFAGLALVTSIGFVITGQLTPLWIASPLQWVGCVLVLLGDALAADAARSD